MVYHETTKFHVYPELSTFVKAPMKLIAKSTLYNKNRRDSKPIAVDIGDPSFQHALYVLYVEQNMDKAASNLLPAFQ
jgi:hypothetical protein